MTNFVTLFGNLTRDAEAILTRGKSMTRIRVATDRVWTDADGTRHKVREFHVVVAFGQLADQAALYGAKGRRVYIEGTLRTREYEGSDGVRRVATEIVAKSLRLFPNDQDAGPVAAGVVAEGTA